MSTHTVFVYGTLRKGEANHHLLRHARPLGPDRTEPAYGFFSFGGFPGMVPGGETAIAGEVYAVDDRTLGWLDALEEYPGFYDRKVIPLESGREAIAYFLRPEQVAGLPGIPSGDWSRR